MNEVSTDTAALLLDAVEQRGGDAEALWAGLPVSRALLHTRGRRIDWELWVEMMARVAAHYPGQVEHQTAGVGQGEIFVSHRTLEFDDDALGIDGAAQTRGFYGDSGAGIL